MSIYLALGSNLGDRRQYLRAALTALAAEGVVLERISPVVESPAMLPADAPADWNAPFLNVVAGCRFDPGPTVLLERIKRIERRLGRSDPRRWSPRPIDIDILVYDDMVIETDALRIPHPGLSERAFFLTPLTALAPDLEIPGLGKTPLALAEASGRRIPLWMGIVNLTPDSFSDGGGNEDWTAVESRIDTMVASGVHWLDFGAESTRPGATPLGPNAEWARLEPMLGRVRDKFAGELLKPLISVDTYHAEVAARSLALGADMINDVGGLGDPAMIDLAASSGAEFVAMHNLGLPADPQVTLATSKSTVGQVETWLAARLERWQARQLDPARIVFDPGVGFGKNPLQSLELLRDIGRFRGFGLRLLVGHSRKSFMRGFAGSAVRDRDLVTIGTSLALSARGVDIIRVHNVADHVTAYRGWSQLESAG